MSRRLTSFPEFVDAVLLHGKDAGDFVIQSCTAEETAAAGRILLECMSAPAPDDRSGAAIARRIARTAPMLEERQIEVAVGAYLNRRGNKAGCM
jgi:hypothetical protein